MGRWRALLGLAPLGAGCVFIDAQARAAFGAEDTGPVDTGVTDTRAWTRTCPTGPPIVPMDDLAEARLVLVGFPEGVQATSVGIGGNCRVPGGRTPGLIPEGVCW